MTLQKPGTVGPEFGTTDRYLLQEALSYVSSEVHASIGPLFSKPTGDVAEFCLKRLYSKFKFLNETRLVGKKFLLGDKVSVADFYLYIVISWHPYVGVDLTPYPVVVEYYERVKNLDAVAAATARIFSEVPPSTTF